MSRKNLLSILLLFILLFTGTSFSQRSKISGTVKDAETNEPIMGANVVVVGTRLGASTDPKGNYNIINIPVGTYSIQVSMLSYKKKIISDVLVSADRTTALDVSLSSSVYEGEEIVITAQRDYLHKEVSNTQLVVTDEQIQNTAGIRDINAFLEKQPGVSSSNGFLEIRGGSADQTGTFVNGMAFNNAANGNSETSVPLSAIDQVSLLSGGYNAEYGNFRSGLINVTTKSGKKERYYGTITVSKNIAHMKRFGQSMSDPFGPGLASILDPQVAFVGTAAGWADDPYKRNQHDVFGGWNAYAANYNSTVVDERLKATPLDFYLLSAWMHMAIPDYAGLAKLGYNVSDEQKRLFAEHAWKEEGTDYNIDFGFGGPVPFVSSYLGDATFFISHNTQENYFVVPVSRRSDLNHTTLGTIKTTPLNTLTITLNGLWKREQGVSPIKPAFGDSPDASREGGFMTIDNLKYFNKLQNLDNGYNYWYDPSIFPLLDQTSIMAGININHVLSKSTFWELNLSYLSMKDHSPTGDNRNMTALTNFGPFPVTEMPYGKLQFASNDRVIMIKGNDTLRYTFPAYDAFTGVNRRFRSKEGDLYTNVFQQQYRAKLDVVSQIGDHNYFKGGIEYNRIDLDHKLWMKWNSTGPYNSYEYNYHRVPSQTGAYLQDQVTYEGVIANLGTRFDYFYGGGGLWPSGDPFAYAFTSTFGGAPRSSGAAADSFYAALASGRSMIWEKWIEYDKEHPGFLQPVKSYFTISPRLGLSFPVTATSKFYFNYGHFRSNPPYYSMYLIRYRYDKNGLYEMSNPNLEPPKTVSYELGLSSNLFGNYIFSLSGYYKDITGQNGDVAYSNSDGSVDYDFWANNNYQDIQGIEFNITKNDNSWLTGWINFNYMLKKSGLTGVQRVSTVPLSDREGLYAGNESRFLPKPVINANISFNSPDDMFASSLMNTIASNWRATFFAEWSAGDYFTYNPLNKLHLSNNLQWPDYFMVDLKVSKSFTLAGFSTTFFLDISNLFNFKVSMFNKGYAFRKNNTDSGSFTSWADANDYLSSLHLPMYESKEFDELRSKPENAGKYIAGNDKVGDLRSDSKPYINDPDYSYFFFGQPRDIWFGVRIDF